MKKEVTLINHWAFRLISPPIYAIFIYVLVLLFFGSASNLSEHFFSLEYVICVILCYINFELWRLVVLLCSRICKSSPWQQIIYQSIVAILTSLAFTGLLVSAYFKYIVGLFNYTSELTIFLALFVFSSILYQMVYLSIFLLNYQHQDIIKKQKQLKKEADNNWLKFQNKINPQLLYKSLETLIGLVHNKHEKSDELIAELSGIYRKILEHNDDLIEVEKEWNLVEALHRLIEIIYNDKVNINLDKKSETKEAYLIPGYLLLCIQDVINVSIINNLQPLHINIVLEELDIIIDYKENKSLNENTTSISLANENKQIAWYTQREVEANVTKKGIKEIKIPLIFLND